MTSAHQPPANLQLTSAHVERFSELRKETLRSLRGDIPVSVYDSLSEKIRREEALLHEILETDKHAAEQRKREGILRREYFVRIPLDASFF